MVSSSDVPGRFIIRAKAGQRALDRRAVACELKKKKTAA
jgi:hypothetical protein